MQKCILYVPKLEVKGCKKHPYILVIGHFKRRHKINIKIRNNMKRLTTILLLILSITVYGQDKDKPTLNVTGVARVTVKPDLGVLNISVSEVKPKMGDAIKALGDKSNYYNDLLKKMGFNEKDVKTTSFTVSKNQIYKENEYIDSGYVASQNIRLEFVYDQITLQKIVFEFSKSDKPINFSFDFELSEELKQKVQAQIIDYAVKDGNEKAKGIAKAAGLKLVKISDITYGSWGRESGMDLVEKRHSYAAAAMASGDGSTSFNFTPDDLIFRDTLTIIWIVE
jgi:uncharacterized protein YggE